MKIKKKQVVVNETIHTTEYVGNEINENSNNNIQFMKKESDK